MQEEITQKESFLDDVEFIAHQRGTTIAEACSFIGISRSSYYKVKADMMLPSKKSVRKVSDAKFRVRENFIEILKKPKDELATLIPDYEKEQQLIRKIQELSGWLSERDMLEGMTKTARKLLDEYFAEHAGEKFKALKNAMEDLLVKTSNKETIATCIRILDEIRSQDPSVDRLLSRMWLGMKLPPRN
jgi:transcriptional regulator with XRE-family HTH domain